MDKNQKLTMENEQNFLKPSWNSNATESLPNQQTEPDFDSLSNIGNYFDNSKPPQYNNQFKTPFQSRNQSSYNNMEFHPPNDTQSLGGMKNIFMDGVGDFKQQNFLENYDDKFLSGIYHSEDNMTPDDSMTNSPLDDKFLEQGPNPFSPRMGHEMNSPLESRNPMNENYMSGLMNPGYGGNSTGNEFDSTRMSNNYQMDYMRSPAGSGRENKGNKVPSMFSRKMPSIHLPKSNSPRIDSPISPISPLSTDNHLLNSLPKISNQSPRDHMARANNVRQCAAELYKIRPIFRKTMERQMKENEDSDVILKTMALYAEILSSWKKQTLFIYKRMRDSLGILHQKLELEMTQSRMMYRQFSISQMEMRERNKELETNLQIIRKSIENSGLNSYDINIKTNEIRPGTKRKKPAEDDKELPKELPKEHPKDSLAQPNGSSMKPVSDAESIAEDLIKAQSAIEQLRALKKYNDGQMGIDADSMVTPQSRPEMEKLCSSLSAQCARLHRKLKDEKLVEEFLGGSRSANRMESIDVVKVLDQRVTADGKTQLFVSCAANPVGMNANEKIQSKVLAEAGENSPFTECVWVDKNTLSEEDETNLNLTPKDNIEISNLELYDVLNN